MRHGRKYGVGKMICALAIAMSIAGVAHADQRAASPQMSATMPKTTQEQRRAAAAQNAARKAAVGQKNQVIQPRSAR